jgi:hypothetical protein
MALGSTQPLVKISIRYISGGKGGRCVRLASPPSCAECHEIWEPKPPGTLWTTMGLLQDSFIPKQNTMRVYKGCGDKVPHIINLRMRQMWVIRCMLYSCWNVVPPGSEAGRTQMPLFQCCWWAKQQSCYKFVEAMTHLFTLLHYIWPGTAFY